MASRQPRRWFHALAEWWALCPFYARIAIAVSWSSALAFFIFVLTHVGSHPRDKELAQQSPTAGTSKAADKADSPDKAASLSREDGEKPSRAEQPQHKARMAEEDASAAATASGKLAGKKKSDVQPSQVGPQQATPFTESSGTAAPADERPPDTHESSVAEAPSKPADESAAEPADANADRVERAVQALLAVMKDKENRMGYAFSPISGRKIDHYEKVQRHYSNKTFTEPVYQYEYETVMVTRPITEGTRTMMKTMPERRVVSQKQVGTRRVEREVYDPDGPIVRSEDQPVYGPGGPDQESEGWLGNNAMALTALLRSGVSPEKEPVLLRLAERLALHVDTFGLPDSTWDLAWAMIAFVEYPGRRYDSHLERLYGRLLSGQIAQGPGKGLWGPVCVSPALLRRICEELANNPAAFLPPGRQANGNVVPAVPLPQIAGHRGAAMPANPNGPTLKSQIETAQERAFIAFNAVSIFGSRFARATQYTVLKDEHGTYGNDVSSWGWPFNLYREVTGDLESTALAAYALRIVAEHHTLPSTIDFPRGVSVATAFSTHEALAAALVAVSEAQQPDGSWNEMIVWQPVEEFRNGSEGQFGPLVQIPKELPSRSPPIATAQACAAIQDLLMALDHISTVKSARPKSRPVKPVKPVKPAKAAKPLKLAGPATYREQIAKGRLRLRELIALAARDQARGLAPGIALGGDEANGAARRRLGRLGRFSINPVWGGILEPYAAICQLRLDNAAAKDAGDASDLATQTFIGTTVGQQMPSGFWPTLADGSHWTPSLRERALFLVTHAPAEDAGDAAAPAAAKPGKAARNPRAKPRGGKDETDQPQANEKTDVEIQRALYQQFYRYRFIGNGNEAERLATAFMLHYLSGAMTAAAPAADSSAGGKPPTARAPRSSEKSEPDSAAESDREETAPETPEEP